MRVVDARAVGAALEALDRERPRLVVAGNFATPWALLDAAVAVLPEARLFVLNPQDGWPVREGLVTESPFVGPGARRDPWLDYLPMRLSLVPRLFDTLRPPDVVLLHTSAPRRGRVSMGIEVNVLPAAVERVRRRGGLVLAQVNPQMPYTRGDGELDVDQVDLALEVDGPLPSPAPAALDPRCAAVGERAAAYLGDGGTLQLGIGQIPDAATAAMTGRRGVGVWSETISDGVLALERAGVLDPDRHLTVTFLFGSPDLYAWADDNPRLAVRRTEVVNDPARIALHPGMCSINSALQVDLSAQANASYVHGRVHSGFGGQPDFVVGALHSAGGHAVVALRSWHDRSDASCIVPVLDAPVCSFQHSVVVTEHGAAEIFGRSRHGQARELITKAADPRARDELRRAAGRLGLLRPEG